MLNPAPLPKAPEAANAILSDALAALANEQGNVPREAVVGAFRRHLARIQNYVQHAFEQEQITGLQAARLLGKLIDGVIARAVRACDQRRRPGRAGAPQRRRHRRLRPRRAGAVQRHRPAVPHRRATRRRRRCSVVEYMLYFLWDLGLKVGHATRSIEDCLVEGGKDTTIRTALLDARHLAGDSELFGDFHRASAPPARMPASPTTSPPSRPSARCATAATATARSWSSRTSRKAAAGCATCRRCTGSRATCSTRRPWANSPMSATS